MDKPVAQSQLDTDVSARSAKPEAVRGALYAARKVPEITIFFWIIKILSTGMGETTSDFLVKQMDPVIAVAIGAACFFAALLLQLAVRRYIAWVYWLAVVMVAVFGTMCADVLHVKFGVPYIVSSTFFAIALAAVFIVWYATERTLSIHTIYTLRRELFYWLTVVTTFALGTAVGDLTATTFPAVGSLASPSGHLGYLASGILFAILFAVPGVAYKLFGLNEVMAFWLAYIVTRPLGASFSDWVGRPPSLGGLGLGTGLVSLILAIAIAILVGYLSVTRIDIHSDSAADARSRRSR
jgi:uncharacterized membrane-anchored protein